MDVSQGQDAAEEIARDHNLGALEGDRAGMPHDAGADLDEPLPQATQGPRGDPVGQLGGLQEPAEVVGKGIDAKRRRLICAKPKAPQSDNYVYGLVVIRRSAGLRREVSQRWQCG